MIENILTILYVILISGVGACTTYFYQFIIGNPDKDEVYLRSIFSFFGVWLEKKYNKIEDPIENSIVNMGGMKSLHYKDRMKIALNVNIWKPLGICIYCSNVYITAIVTGRQCREKTKGN